MAVDVLSLQKFSVLRNSAPIFEDLDVELDNGEIAVFLGRQSAGKSLLAKSIIGQYSNIQGVIKVLGFSLNPISSAHLNELRQKIAYVSPEFPLIKNKTVRVNLSLSLLASNRIREDETDLMIQQQLIALDIEHLSSRICSELSGSEDFLVRIARGLVGKPRLILIDDLNIHKMVDEFPLLETELINLNQKDKLNLFVFCSETRGFSGDFFQNVINLVPR